MASVSSAERRTSAVARKHPRARVMTLPALFGAIALVVAVLAMIFPREALQQRAADAKVVDSRALATRPPPARTPEIAPSAVPGMPSATAAPTAQQTPAQKPDAPNAPNAPDASAATPEPAASTAQAAAPAPAPNASPTPDPLTTRLAERARLAPLLDSPDAQTRRNAIQQDLALVTSLLADTVPGTIAHRQWTKKLLALLERAVRESWDDATLLELARLAVAHGFTEIAGTFYESYLAQAQQPSRQVIDEIVGHYLGQSNYRAAAAVQFKMQARARALTARREWFFAAITTLRGSDDLRATLEAADQSIGDLADDEPTLQFLTRIALAANDQRRAQDYARRMLRIRPLAQASGQGNRLTRHTQESLVQKSLTNEALVHEALGQKSLGQKFLVQESLVQRSLLEGSLEFVKTGFIALAALLISPARAQGTTPAPANPPANPPVNQTVPEVALRPYNEASYTLAYSVFIANSNFRDARQVAQAAVSQRPADDAWRERLAQVSEWAGDGPAALALWSELAARQRSDTAIQGMLRLAPGLGRDDLELSAWLMVNQRRPVGDKDAQHIATLYERTGQIDEALRWLRERFDRDGNLDWLARRAELAERAKRYDEAIEAYEFLFARGGMSVDRVLALALLQFSRSNIAGAFTAIQRARAQAGARDVPYWQLYGELAWRLGNNAEAHFAYEQLRQSGNIQAFELIRLVRSLREQGHLQSAALAGEDAWLKTRDPQFFAIAAEAYAELGSRAGLDRLYAAVTEADLAKLGVDPFFFTMRGRWHLDNARSRQALGDFNRALALRPQDPNLRAQLLWLLIELRNIPALRHELARSDAASRTHAVLWGPFAAGWQVAGEPQRALSYYRRLLRERADDYLLLHGYADALEQMNEGGMAWRVRRHAWHSLHSLRAKLNDKTAADANKNLIETIRETPRALTAYARLVTQLQPGDPALSAVRQVLASSASTATSGSRTLDAATRELVLSYTIGAGEFDRARAWMWTQYGRRLVRPEWADIALALESNDLDRLEKILGASGDRLQRYDRVRAARMLEARSLAQSYGAASLEQFPFDDETHQRLGEDLRGTTSSIVAGATGMRFGPLHSREFGLRLNHWLTPSLRLSPFITEAHQRSADRSTLREVPQRDRSIGLDTTWRSDLGGATATETTLRVAERSALADTTQLSLRHQRRYGSRVSTFALIGRNLPATETAALRVGGMKDEAALGLTYDFSRREYLRVGLNSARYFTQARTPIGSGTRIEAETGYRLRLDYPNLIVRLQATQSRFAREASTDSLVQKLNPDGTIPPGSFFLPPRFNSVAAGVGFGQALREEYSRAIRPFADLSVSHNSVIGRGFSALAGVGGSAFGNDFLSAGILRARGGAGLYTGATEIFIRYQLFF